MKRLGLVLLLLALAPDVRAGSVDTPECRRDLQQASAHIRAVSDRDRKPGVARGDTAGMCRLLRWNDTDMTAARRLMAPCLTGHERGENIGQLDASLGDIRRILAQRCQ